jgi:hypothetical protein
MMRWSDDDDQAQRSADATRARHEARRAGVESRGDGGVSHRGPQCGPRVVGNGARPPGGELQSAREDTNSLLMSPEQQAEIRRFQDEQLRIRRELRAVRRELDSNIERLGTVLKLTNILGVHLALSLFGLITLLIRRNRRRAVQ